MRWRIPTQMLHGAHLTQDMPSRLEMGQDTDRIRCERRPFSKGEASRANTGNSAQQPYFRASRGGVVAERIVVVGVNEGDSDT